MKYDCDILLFGTMGDIGDRVRESLEGHGLVVRSAGFPQNVFYDEFGYRRAMMKVLSGCHPRMIMPIGNLIAASRLGDIVPDDVILPVPDERTVRLLDSKTGASRLATEAGVPQPQLYRSAEDTPDRQMVFKRDSSFGGSGVHRPRGRESLENLIRHENGKPYLIEEYIEGTDCSIDVLRWGGRTMSACYKSSSELTLGPASVRERIQSPLLEECASRLLDASGYYGVCGMDFRIDAGGNAYFLECNPRFTGGVGFQIENGFDIPWEFYKMCILEGNS